MTTYKPRKKEVTIWEYQKDEDGREHLRHVELVQAEDFKEEHLNKILKFFDQCKAKDPSFNKTKAIDSTFILVEENGQQSLVQPEDEVKDVVEQPEEVSEELKAEYKALYGRNPRSDWSLETVLAKIEEKKNNDSKESE